MTGHAVRIDNGTWWRMRSGPFTVGVATASMIWDGVTEGEDQQVLAMEFPVRQAEVRDAPATHVGILIGLEDARAVLNAMIDALAPQ